MSQSKRLLALSNPLRVLLRNPQLKAIRNGLTLTLPLVMAGSIAALLNNFPVQSYRDFMVTVFGEHWRMFGVYISNGTMAIMSLIMLFTISYSLAEHYNTRQSRQAVHPAVLTLVCLASLMTLIEPLEGGNIPARWLGIYGLFIAIFTAFAASWLFLRLRSVRRLSISFYSEEADQSIPYAFSGLLPGILTIAAFALFKWGMARLGIDNIHAAFYEMLSHPFDKMGNTYVTAMLYNFLRHFFWFFGIHGSNLMEPVTSSIYVPAMQANIAAAAAGQPPPYIFTKTLFDAYLSMGGSGATICLIFACFIHRRQGSMYRISQLSLAPAIFNINEMLVFGFPIALNPLFIIPFLLTPLVLCTVAYLAVSSGLVPPTIAEIDWTAPVIIGGYAATGSIAGSLLQLVNVAIGVAIYLPFVKIADSMKRKTLSSAFRELLDAQFGGESRDDFAMSGEALSLERSLANDLSEAIRNKELSLEYQPQVDSLTGRVFGVEALLRWNHSHLGRIPPGLFIALAEDSGCIRDIGNWVIDEAAGQLADWRGKGLTDVTMSVNMSVHQLADPKLVPNIQKTLEARGVPPEMFEVEVTESTALGPEGGHSKVLHRIHELGVKLAIDDFGMGHTSLVYLKYFPVDVLKIDRVLSKDVLNNRHSVEIISTIAELCRSLNIKPIVEFVDEQAQLRAIQSVGCQYIQGYLYSPPLPPDRCFDYIRAGAKIY